MLEANSLTAESELVSIRTCCTHIMISYLQLVFKQKVQLD